MIGLVLSGCLGPPIVIAPTELSAGVTGTEYLAHLTADRESQNWAVVGGSLPAGLSLSGGGTISGVPREAGAFTFTARTQAVRDPAREDEQAFTLVIIEKLALSAALPTARRAEAFSYTPTVSGGTQPYAFIIVGLPAGIDYDRATGRIFGTPVTEASQLHIEIDVSDSASPQQTATQQLAWTIKPPGVSITTTTLPAGKVAAAYSTTIAIADGVGPLTFSITSGVLPDGLRLTRNTGVISGTPTTAQTHLIIVEVRDSDVPESVATRELSIEIAP